jgi:hypothetical protein
MTSALAFADMRTHLLSVLRTLPAAEAMGTGQARGVGVRDDARRA